MDFIKCLKDEHKKAMFIEDFSYKDLNNGTAMLSSVMANANLIEDTCKAKKIFDFSKTCKFLTYDDCDKLGIDLMNNLYLKGMLGISESEELFSDMFEFNISDENSKA